VQDDPFALRDKSVFGRRKGPRVEINSISFQCEQDDPPNTFCVAILSSDPGIPKDEESPPHHVADNQKRPRWIARISTEAFAGHPDRRFGSFNFRAYSATVAIYNLHFTRKCCTTAWLIRVNCAKFQLDYGESMSR